jgi:glycosyltransferase involved in cell wall biosynthesis
MPELTRRVLHVYKDVYPPVVGGIERHIDSIRLALPDIRHDVLACSRGVRTRKRTASAPRVGTEVLVGEFGRLYSTPIAPAFPLWLSRLAGHAVVHLHMPQPLAELSALLLRTRPLVVSYHADIFRQRRLLFWYGPLVRRCLRSADVVITGSDALRLHSPLLNEAKVNAHVVPYIVDVDFWNASRADTDSVRRHRVTYGQAHLLAVGRLVSYKGFDRLISGAHMIDSPIVIVGDGPERANLHRLIASRGLEGKVHLVGALSDEELLNHYAAATAFVLPSWNRAESFGIALLEAQSVGLPVVAIDVGTGIREAFLPGTTGLLVPPNDLPALAAAITQLTSNPERARSMGRTGREWVKRTHSAANLARSLRPAYEGLFEAGRVIPSF